MGQSLAPQTRFSTHDWTAPITVGGEEHLDFVEAWADTKSPGDGRTYVVGTVEVPSVIPGTTLFSTQPALPSAGGGFLSSGAQVRQVAFVQVNNPALLATQAGIEIQKFFYGESGTATNPDIARATNGRGISVWPAATRQDTRVVICGETFDERLPQSQLPLGWTSTSASGFIAVYDGSLNLLWTHHLFGSNPNGASAVTDVSVRVEFENGVPVRDVVTYCGISSHGNPSGGNASLTPLQPFSATAAGTLLCPLAADGATDNGFGQWDGFVGRVSRNHDASGTTSLRFHSVVGGNAQDGLFGISEMTPDRFAVVGSTAANRPGVVAGLGTAVFPFFKLFCPIPTDSYCMGTVQVFDASALPGGPLVLASSGAIGVPNESSTIARDVVARPALVDFDASTSTREDALFVVGSTSDGALSVTGVTVEPFSGGTDGFLQVLSPASAPPQLLLAQMTTYRGGPGADGLTGVNSWNEFVDQVVVTGFREYEASFSDIDVASYYIYAGGFVPAVDLSLRPLRAGQIGGSNDDRPTMMGTTTATNGSGTVPAFSTFGLGDPAGGGVAQDDRGRTTVVGRTLSVPPAGYPVVGAARSRSTTLTPPGQATKADAVRSEFDMLPSDVGRTDGTGPVTPVPGLPFPRPNTNGGTTPPCALTQFGSLLGLPLPAANRLLIDYEGPPPAGGNTAGIVVVRAPATTGVVAAALQVAFPGNLAGNPLLLPDGIEIWTPSFAVLQLYFPGANVDRPFRDVIPGLPATATFTVQVAFLLGAPVTAGNTEAGIPCGGSTTTIVSPALWIKY